MKKLFLSAVLACVSSATLADTVKLSDGNSCSFDADDTPWEVSLEGKAKQADNDGVSRYHDPAGYYNNNDENHIGLKVSYRFGGPKRLDCSKLYDIQLRSKEAELRLLKQQLDILQSNASIDWNDDLG
ncbi:MAG: hypothetical protein GKR86_00245 [Ilumatobacter sp.]|nr:hypothetical protein [Ilumatobacter sp.]